MEKNCKKCGVFKPIEEFANLKQGLYGKSAECKNCLAQRHKAYKDKRRGKIKKYNRQWNQSNKDYILEYNKAYLKEKYKSDPILKFKANIRSHINVRLKKFIKTKKGTTLNYLGCDWPTFINHIESQFNPKMTWENYGRGKYWEIDHIIPLSKSGSFHYTNCQPMSIFENRSKSNKIEKNRAQ